MSLSNRVSLSLIFLIMWGSVTLRSVVGAFVTRHSGSSLRQLVHGRQIISARPVSSFKRFESLPPDYTIIEDDDDDEEEISKSDLPDFTIIEDDEDDAADDSPADFGGDYDDASEVIPTQRSRKKASKQKVPSQTSWMEKNTKFPFSAEVQKKQEKDTSSRQKREPKKTSRQQKGPNRSFRDDFRGTRVFVQGLDLDTSWQDLKDHFRIAGEVVFASISVDGQTGESKGCGVVQFETSDEARNAIKVMRDHPLDGATLYVREDVQEKAPMPRGGGNTTPPSKWKCANEANTEKMSQEERTNILSIIRARDQARRRRNYDASDDMRDELKYKYGVHVDDRLKLWWTDVDGRPPEMISEIKGEGRWGKAQPWRQIPTTPENDMCVNPELVEGLLRQRDIARREKDFDTADALLEEARNAPDGELYLRIHDESRTWRIWTEAPPPKPVQHQRSQEDMRQIAAEQCIEIVTEHAPDKVPEVRNMLNKFPGREYNILKKLKQRYGNADH